MFDPERIGHEDLTHIHPILTDRYDLLARSRPRCGALGICGLPPGHPGAHIPNHALVECIDIFACGLCLWRNRHRARRYTKL